MVTFELIAEYIALLLIIVLLCSGSGKKEIPNLRLYIYRRMFVFALFSIIITIFTITLINNYKDTPPIILNAFTTLHYILGPSVTVCAFFYTLSQIEITSKKLSNYTNWFLYLLPYVVFILYMTTNTMHNRVFYFSPDNGYCRGKLFFLPYLVTFAYVLGIYIYTLKNMKKTKNNNLIVLCISISVASVISVAQIINRHILLANFASVISILIINLNIQNAKTITDKLTNIYNRYTLLYYLDRYAKKNISFSLYIFSFQNFKNINEKYGLSTGDAILIKNSQLFLHIFPKEIISRYTGDEFAILTTKSTTQFEPLLHKIVSELEKPCIIKETEIKQSFVYTRVDYPYFSKDVKSLISTADYAISLLKNKFFDKNYLYDAGICNEMKRMTTIIEVLQEAIKNNGFEVHYQPIYSNKTKDFIQAEALARLKNGKELSLFPSEFIPVAEKTDIIITLTYIVLEEVCKNFRYLINKYGKDMHLQSISINFPYKIFFQSNMYNSVMKILHKYDIKPEQIKIEITERSLITEDKKVINVIEQMKKQGFTFELDDFGIEYSNMSVFLKLPIKYLKIDRSLVVVSVENKECRPFFQNLVQGIHSLDKSIIVEGVENSEQLDFIENCGCEYIQGFVYSKPLPLKDLELFLLEKTTNIKK